ncbi:hypothetical protein ACFS4T_04915 [Pseudomonas lini]
MFWKKDKSIRVELVTPITLVAQKSSRIAAGQKLPPRKTSELKRSETNIDLAFKLINYAGLGLQAALVVYGYSLLVGYYNGFGIDTNEIALSTPSLLLYGYINLFSGALAAANYVPIIGPGILAFCFIAVAAAFVVLVVKNARVDTVIGLACWIGFLIFMAFFCPSDGCPTGHKKMSKADVKGFTPQELSKGLDKQHSLTTDKGTKLIGTLILADGKSTFLLVDRTVYKVDSARGRVLRETLLSPKPDPIQSTKQESRKN